MYEIQFHPADIRKKVRYLFLSRRGARWVVAGLAAAAVVLLLGLALSPLGVRSLLLASDLHSARHQHRLQREIMAQRQADLGRLQARTDLARARQRQMGLILGAEQEERGLGGFPDPVRANLTVLEATVALRRAGRLETETKALLTLADELARFARENQELTRVVPSICPLPVGSFVLTSPFGHRTSPFTGGPDFHAGIDLAAREGTPVSAAGDGRVVFAGRFPLRRNVRWWRYGNVVVLAHGHRFITIYAHLESINVRRDQRVKRGAEIGTVGSTGWSTSPHLHYEVRRRDEGGGEPVPTDPRIYILNYQWSGQEALLAASRTAPPPEFDPLPSIVAMR